MPVRWRFYWITYITIYYSFLLETAIVKLILTILFTIYCRQWTNGKTSIQRSNIPQIIPAVFVVVTWWSNSPWHFAIYISITWCIGRRNVWSCQWKCSFSSFHWKKNWRAKINTSSCRSCGILFKYGLSKWSVKQTIGQLISYLFVHVVTVNTRE